MGLAKDLAKAVGMWKVRVPPESRVLFQDIVRPYIFRYSELAIRWTHFHLEPEECTEFAAAYCADVGVEYVEDEWFPLEETT